MVHDAPGEPGPDISGAHAYLAAVDPTASPEEFLNGLLGALLRGAGRLRGALLDTRNAGRVAVLGEGLRREDALRLATREGGRPLEDQALSPDAIHEFFGGVGDPRALPLTAGDDTLALFLLDSPPVDPIGFSSVAAHAASLLAWVRMSEKVREAEFELKYRVWELESLYDVGLSIAGTLDLDSLADDILLKSVSLLNARAGALVVRDLSEADRVLVKNFGGELLESQAALELPDEMVLSNDRASRTGILAAVAAEKILAVPIRSDGALLGVLIVADKETRAGGIDDFNKADARILSLFGNQAAIALENARLHREAVDKERIEREIELAAAIQRTILPEALPEVGGLELFGSNRPTRQVGGDYFDVHALPDGRVAFCVADVSGKGVPAALLVSTVHACMHLLVDREASDLVGLIAHANRHLSRFSATRKFVTLFFAVYDPKTRVLNYVNAGHNPGIHLTKDRMDWLSSTGLPIGMLPNVVHRNESLAMSPGDLLVLYSDGITEAIDGKDEEFGPERLGKLVLEGRNESPRELSRRVFAAVDEFTRGVAQYDDQTVLVARVP